MARCPILEDGQACGRWTTSHWGLCLDHEEEVIVQRTQLEAADDRIGHYATRSRNDPEPPDRAREQASQAGPTRGRRSHWDHGNPRPGLSPEELAKISESRKHEGRTMADTEGTNGAAVETKPLAGETPAADVGIPGYTPAGKIDRIDGEDDQAFEARRQRIYTRRYADKKKAMGGGMKSVTTRKPKPAPAAVAPCHQVTGSPCQSSSDDVQAIGQMQAALVWLQTAAGQEAARLARRGRSPNRYVPCASASYRLATAGMRNSVTGPITAARW